MSKRELICFLINLVFVMVVSMIMGSAGYGPDTWQWWACVLCMSFNHIAGKESVY